MCNYHYQGFIDSIRELLKVSTDAAHLKVVYVKIQSYLPFKIYVVILYLES